MKVKTINKNFDDTGIKLLGSLNNHYINFDKLNKNKSKLSKEIGIDKDLITNFANNVERFSNVQLGELYNFFDKELIQYMLSLDVVPKWLDTKESNEVLTDKFKLQLSEHLYSINDNKLKKYLEVLNISNYEKQKRKLASLGDIKAVLESYNLEDDEIQIISKLIWAMEPNESENIIYFGEYALTLKDVDLDGFHKIEKYNISIQHSEFAEEINFNNILLPNGEKGDVLCKLMK